MRRPKTGRSPQPPLADPREGRPPLGAGPAPVGGPPDPPPVAVRPDLRHLDILSFVQSTQVQ